MNGKNLLTPEEKLDYIYNYIKKEQKINKYKSIFKWIFRFLILIYILYSYFVLWPNLKNNYIEPLLKPFGIKSLSIDEIKSFFDNSKNKSMVTPKNGINGFNGINIDEKKLEQIKNLLTN